MTPDQLREWTEPESADLAEWVAYSRDMRRALAAALDKAERLKGHAEALLEQLRTMRIHFVSTLESARERIVWNGGECDSVEKMEADDPYLKSSWKVMEAYRAEFKPEEPKP